MTSDIGEANLAALGRIAMASTGIQMIAEQMIWALLGVGEPAGRALTDRATASWLAERLERLAQRTELDPGLAEQVVDFARGARTAFQVRNDNLHGVWIALEQGEVVRLRSVLVDGREGPEFLADVAVASGNQLSNVADGMEGFAQLAHALLERVRAATS
jgi:hypothetical protein